MDSGDDKAGPPSGVAPQVGNRWTLSAAARRRGLTLILAFLVADLTLMVFLPCLRNGFVRWDDPLTIYENPRIWTFGLDTVRWAFTSMEHGYWYPLTHLSLAADHAIWGLDPRGFHLTNILLHAANATLVFLIVLRLARSSSGTAGRDTIDRGPLVVAVLSALLFSLHPLRVESVAWASERKDVLYAFFFLLAIRAHLQFAARSTARWGAYARALVFFALALMSKPMAVTLPLVLLVLDFYPLGRWQPGGGGLRNAGRLVFEKLPFLGLSALMIVATLTSVPTPSLEDLPLQVRILGPLRRYVLYLVKMAWPTELVPYVPVAPINYAAFPQPEHVLYLGVLLAMTAVALATRRTHKVFSAAWGFYVVVLLPAIGFVQNGGAGMADRFTYLASLGPAVLVAALVASVLRRSQRGWHTAVTSLLCVVALGGLAALTVRQIAVWEDSVSLWSHQIRESPTPLQGPYFRRAGAYLAEGKLTEARRDFTEALKLTPRSLGGQSDDPILFGWHHQTGDYLYTERARASYLDGDYEQAVADYGTVLSTSPDLTNALVERGRAQARRGQLYSALNDFNRALKLDPGLADAYLQRGLIYEKLAARRQALKDLDRAARLSPESWLVHHHLARVYGALWNPAEARAHAAKARALGVPRGVLTWHR